jgi:hypothetical protein
MLGWHLREDKIGYLSGFEEHEFASDKKPWRQ